MDRGDSLTSLTEYLNCLSVFELNASLLYKGLADRLEQNLIKALLLGISNDCQKNSAILKAIVNCLPETEWKIKDCSKKIGEAWQKMDTLSRELAETGALSDEELGDMCDRLVLLEFSMGLEYSVFEQLKTRELLVNEMKALYNINVDGLKNLLAWIIRDQERHREVLAAVKELTTRMKPETKTRAPTVKFQNPDGWHRPF
ncbi:MAG: hypothetical protein ACE14S_02445 [Candidatus Bathyarchaeia archaeon]